MTDATQTPQTPAQIKRKNAAQDKEMAAAIAAGGVFITTIQNAAAQGNSELADMMVERSYDSTKLTAGLALNRTAQTKFDARQAAMTVADTAQAKLTASRKDALNRFAAYRRDGRSGIRTAVGRNALGLSGVVPDDTEHFITIARAAYSAAAGDSYAGTLGDFGYSGTRRVADLASIDVLEADNGANNRAAGVAERTTDARDKAFKAFDSWQNQAEDVAHAAFHDRPDILRQLKLKKR